MLMKNVGKLLHIHQHELNGGWINGIYLIVGYRKGDYILDRACCDELNFYPEDNICISCRYIDEAFDIL